MIPTNQRPTPETNAFIGDQDEDCMTEGEIALCKFTRSLEQRLAESQEKLSILESQYTAQVTTTKIAFEERDTAHAQILALHGALQDATDNCLWRSDNEHPLSKEESQRIYNKAIEALSSPPPPVVPLTDLQPFLAAIAAYAEFNGGCDHHPEDCPQEAEECKIVAAFNTTQLAFFHKHPAAHFPKS